MVSRRFRMHDPLSLGAALLSALLLVAPPHTLAQGAKPVPKGPVRVTAVEGVNEYRLANGLKILLIPDRSIDTITVNVTYLVGSRHEGYGESGMAHLLEHLMFRGTKRFPNIKADFQQRGARYNGSTSFDRTNYYETFPASEKTLDHVLDVEADRMVTASVAKRDLDAEMTVVRNEFESGENSPFGVLRERVAASAYLWHNYGRAIIGARSDIENVPLERLKAFYRHYYQPDNAVLILSGRFDESTALALAQKRFGRIPKPSRGLRHTYTAEPTQDGERSVMLRRAGDVQLVSALYHMPPGAHPEYAAVDVLVSLLNHVPSGRLHKALVGPGLAASVSAPGETGARSPWPTLARPCARTPPSKPRATLLSAARLRAHPAAQDEVERARTRLLNDSELTLADSRALTNALSETVAIGDWRLFFLHRDRLKRVTSAEVQAVASRYLRPANRTLGMFLPTKEPERAEIPPVPDVSAMLKDYRGSGAISQGEDFNPTPANIEARVQRRTLPGGMKLALLPKKTRGGTVVAQLSLRWGDEESKAGRAAAGGIAARCLRAQHTRAAAQSVRPAQGPCVGGDGSTVETVR
jgi:zinc protease